MRQRHWRGGARGMAGLGHEGSGALKVGYSWDRRGSQGSLGGPASPQLRPLPIPTPTSASMSASDLMVRSAKAEKAWQAGAGQSGTGTPNLEPPAPRLHEEPLQDLPEHHLPFLPLPLTSQHPAAPPEPPIPEGDPPAPTPWPPASSHAGTPSVLDTHADMPCIVVPRNSRGGGRPRLLRTWTHQGTTALALESGVQCEGNPIHG